MDGAQGPCSSHKPPRVAFGLIIEHIGDIALLPELHRLGLVTSGEGCSPSWRRDPAADQAPDARTPQTRNHPCRPDFRCDRGFRCVMRERTHGRPPGGAVSRSLPGLARAVCASSPIQRCCHAGIPHLRSEPCQLPASASMIRIAACWTFATGCASHLRALGEGAWSVRQPGRAAAATARSGRPDRRLCRAAQRQSDRPRGPSVCAGADGQPRPRRSPSIRQSPRIPA